MSNWANEIEADLNWREGELAAIKIQILTTDRVKHPVRYEALLRAITTLLYAHYEGFCRFAWDLYLDTIQRQNIKRNQCREEVIKLSLRKRFKELGGDLSADGVWSFFSNELPALINENIEFNIRLEADSNLKPMLLKKNSTDAGLSCSMVDQHELLLKTLVSRRNNIAHGQKEIIHDLTEYNKYENAALEAMYELGLSVIDCLDNQKYLKPSNPPSSS
ncbi:MAG: MAE_28990/MAE_18760 family HEPN-like nuclease [Microcystis sp. LE19-131.1A]|jgi:hypothetical protein|uniref:MAE_28990/MAE_18760 family HEPN-like nuclease n=1 Tax=Microcystis TaxID=1125 RepID=UPI000468E7D5|nr:MULTISPECIES: MAE_28990/MAE_18760 family HEPN-like nuclease [Microcystis]MCA2699428.1 hypothetical protein [Microcystis sp. M179S2]MCZ8243916.1 MAE_28990/MAE_18760 family HEPN-like nuclease [Microcystis sp. LE19-131.1A]MDB9396175.1 MAE_28990/MAE_18760 family HEPN-like nuclease [Microcystis aeruginosa CS-573]